MACRLPVRVPPTRHTVRSNLNGLSKRSMQWSAVAAMEHTDQPLYLSESSDQPFGDFLRQLRRAEGWSQAELAEHAGLSLRGVADLERGINRRPRRETLLALARAFGLTGED